MFGEVKNVCSEKICEYKDSIFVYTELYRLLLVKHKDSEILFI